MFVLAAVIFMNALVIFFKYPEKGKVKTRLAKTIGDKKALELYLAFLDDLLKNHTGQNYDLYVYVSPPEKLKVFEKKFKVLKYAAQKGDDVGERVFNCIDELLKVYSKVVVIPSDVPTLTPDSVNDAFFHLDQTDIVMGPVPDGGFYLIGMKEPHNVFEHIHDWDGVKSIVNEAIKVAATKQLELVLLKPGIDIDTEKDLDELKLVLREDILSSTAKAIKKLKL